MEYQKTAEATGDLTGKITKIQNKIIQGQLQIRMLMKISKERYISPEERQKIIDDLRLI